jgi:hypothetical protein
VSDDDLKLKKERDMRPLKKDKHPMPDRSLSPALGPQTKGPEFQLTGSMEQWEEAIFENAAHFTVCTFTGTSPSSRRVQEFATFPEALDMAQAYTKAENKPALIYAIAKAGGSDQARSFCMPAQHWDRYLELWRRCHPKFADQVFCLKEGWYCILNSSRVFGPWPNKGAALAGLATEQRRLNSRLKG